MMLLILEVLQFFLQITDLLRGSKWGKGKGEIYLKNGLDSSMRKGRKWGNLTIPRQTRRTYLRQLFDCEIILPFLLLLLLP